VCGVLAKQSENLIDRRASLCARRDPSFIHQQGNFHMNFDKNIAAKTLVEGGFSTSQAAAIMAILATTQNTMQATGAAPGGYRKLRTPNEIAEDSQNHACLRQINAMCRRWGISLQGDAIVDPIALDASFSAAKADIPSRLAIKTAMAQIGLLA
jgi:hypothetical protein